MILMQFMYKTSSLYYLGDILGRISVDVVEKDSVGAALSVVSHVCLLVVMETMLERPNLALFIYLENILKH